MICEVHGIRQLRHEHPSGVHPYCCWIDWYSQTMRWYRDPDGTVVVVTA